MSEALVYSLLASAAFVAALAAAFHGALIGWMADDGGNAALAFLVPSGCLLALGVCLAVAAFRAIKR
jgi:hypothetical protein